MANFDLGGLLNFEGLDDPTKMGLLQAGAAILAANTGRVPGGSAVGQGLFAGMENMAALKAQQQRLKIMQDEEDRRKAESEMQSALWKQKVDAANQENAAWGRLGDPSNYIKMQETTSQRPVYNPVPAAPGAQAPNFGMSKEMVSETQQTPYMDRDARMRDMWAIPALREKMVEQQFAQPKLHIAPDGTVIDLSNPEILGKNFAADKNDPNKPFVRDAQGNIVPNAAYQQYELGKAERGATRVNQHVNTGYETEVQKQLGKNDAEQVQSWRKAGQGAYGLVQTLDRMDKLSPDIYSGGGANQKVAAVNLIAGITGEAPSKLANSQEFNSLASQLVLDKMGGSLGTGFSNADRDFVQQMVPQITQSAQARKQLTEYLRRRAIENMDLADSAETYVRTTGGLKGFRHPAMSGTAEIKNPAPKPQTKIFKLDNGKSVSGYLGADGNYYTKDGKNRIEE